MATKLLKTDSNFLKKEILKRERAWNNGVVMCDNESQFYFYHNWVGRNENGEPTHCSICKKVWTKLVRKIERTVFHHHKKIQRRILPSGVRNDYTPKKDHKKTIQRTNKVKIQRTRFHK